MNNKEKNTIKSIMNNYRSMHSELESYEKFLNEMESGSLEKNIDRINETGNRIKECVQRLKSQRENEVNFFNEIGKKYGPGEFNPMTLEYNLKK